jgi:methylenetetrahydrofolate reductase (NADPH)
MGRFEERLGRGEPTLSAELPVLNSASAARIRAGVEVLANRVDAISVTDNPGAHAHPSSLAVASLVAEAGADPIMNLACRDRNRLALQSELLGAALHDIRNVLCVTGDDVTSGDHPDARRVFDLDSPQLLAVARTLERGCLLRAARSSRRRAFSSVRSRIRSRLRSTTARDGPF